MCIRDRHSSVHTRASGAERRRFDTPPGAKLSSGSALRNRRGYSAGSVPGTSPGRRARRCPNTRNVARVIDLRNDDEIAKGAKARSEAAREYYDAAPVSSAPFLGDIDAFWGGVSANAPPLPLWPRVSMLWSARPLNAALSRALEDGGNAALYGAILDSAPTTVLVD